MPRTRSNPVMDPNGPRSMRSATIRRASAGPIRASDAISSGPAVSRSTGGRSACDDDPRLVYGGATPSRALPDGRVTSERLRLRPRVSTNGGSDGAGVTQAFGNRAVGGHSGGIAPFAAGSPAGDTEREPLAPRLPCIEASCFPPRPRRFSPPTAIAESTASICRARADRSPATMTPDPFTSRQPRTVTPSAAIPAMKISARRSPGVGMRTH